MVVDYLSSQPDWAGYPVSTKWGSGPTNPLAVYAFYRYGALSFAGSGFASAKLLRDGNVNVALEQSMSLQSSST